TPFNAELRNRRPAALFNNRQQAIPCLASTLDGLAWAIDEYFFLNSFPFLNFHITLRPRRL
ncbi:MAG: hypothetical protein ABI600_17810, partial [Luteolibacter sp.]